jgi:hypothetical protein
MRVNGIFSHNIVFSARILLFLAVFDDQCEFSANTAIFEPKMETFGILPEIED